MKKKLLMLGGADIQVTAIEAAKKLGYYVITADYKPDNPGHQISDEYHNVSTTVLEEIYELAQKLQIDGISSYASDPGALTAAYVGEKMGIPSNSFEAIKLLSDKVTFRQIQKDAGVPYPLFFEVKSGADIAEILNREQKRFIIKPVDSSGSKGVTILGKEDIDQVEAHFTDSVSFSRIDKVILEEHIQRDGFLMSGDVLVQDGEIVFNCFGDVHFNDSINGLVPRSISLPASKPKEFFKEVSEDLKKIFAQVDIKLGTFNVDVIECEDGRPMVIDIGARNGGNMLNDIIHYHTGYDLISSSILQCMGDPILAVEGTSLGACYSHYVIHSDKSGVFESLDISERIKEKIIYQSVLSVKPGDPVNKFINSGCRLGLLLLKYDSFEEMQELLGTNLKDDILIKLKKNNFAERLELETPAS